MINLSNVGNNALGLLIIIGFFAFIAFSNNKLKNILKGLFKNE